MALPLWIDSEAGPSGDSGLESGPRAFAGSVASSPTPTPLVTVDETLNFPDAPSAEVAGTRAQAELQPLPRRTPPQAPGCVLAEP